jgi:hypothetical protein
MNRILGLAILMIASNAAFGQTKPRQATLAQQRCVRTKLVKHSTKTIPRDLNTQ